MRYSIILLLLTIFTITSCKNDTTDAITVAVKKKLTAKAQKEGGFVFSSEKALCNILDKQKIEEIFGVPAGKITYHERGYIFRSPVSASCEARWDIRASGQGKVILQMFCNTNTSTGLNFGDKYLDGEKDLKVEGYTDQEKYQYKEVDGIGDRAILNPGFGLLKWYVGNYVIYSLQIQTGETDYSAYQDELKKMARYVTSRTMETLQ